MPSPRDERRAGTRPDPLGWGIVLLALVALALSHAGCGRVEQDEAAGVVPLGGTVGQPPGAWARIPGGRAYWRPTFLTPALVAGVEAEIDTVFPDADVRITNPPPGVPRHITTIIMLPGAFYTAASPTKLARGQTDMTSTVWVSWRMRPYETTPYLPALAHELRHVYTGDLGAGH
jgi:hypothetical protein